jgi:hypothetical protein
MQRTSNVLYIMQIKGASIIYVAGLDWQTHTAVRIMQGIIMAHDRCRFLSIHRPFLLVGNRGLS